MALSDEQWQKIADKTGCFITGGLKEAIEAEVRKQDTALIRQLVDALEHATAWAEEWRFAPAWVADAQAAICVAGVWLEGKP